MKSSLSILTIILIVCSSCSNNGYFFPDGAFDTAKRIELTDYSQIKNWAAHPDKEDTADQIPEQESLRDQSEFPVDVFFVHPTTLTGYKGETYWNAQVDNVTINQRTDDTTIRLQASVFNTAGKVYAPRYQQAHIEAYYTDDKATGKKALDWAYQDVKAAFNYYLENLNKGRPFIIASHSQGTTHSKKLIAEFIDDKPLQQKLVAAYLIGIIVKKDEFKTIKPCENAEETGCTISWRTYKKDIEPENVLTSPDFLATNPLSWKTDTIYVPKSKNKGSILRNMNKVFDELVDAQVDNGILKVTKPKFFGSAFYTTKNYHIADLNFFYFNTQENAALRVQNYMQKHNLN
jgi:hypothetical protein